MCLKVVLFDMGGTLIRYPVLLTDAVNAFEHHREQFGLSMKVIEDWVANYQEDRATGLRTLKEATFLGALRRSLEKNDPGFLLKRDAERNLLDILEVVYKETFKDTASLIPGAKELLEYVKSRNLQIGLISNTAWPGKFHEGDLKRFAIHSYFNQFIWSSEEGVRKPYKSLFLKPLGHFGVNSPNVVYIGDTFNRDVLGPNGIGMRAIWISSSNAPMPFYGWQAKDLAEVKDILAGIE